MYQQPPPPGYDQASNYPNQAAYPPGGQYPPPQGQYPPPQGPQYPPSGGQYGTQYPPTNAAFNTPQTGKSAGMHTNVNYVLLLKNLINCKCSVYETFLECHTF